MGKNPVIEIDCITMRHDAIFKAIQNGSEVEGCVFHKVPFGVAIYNHIKNIGGYVNLHNLLVLPGLFGVVVQMTPRFYGEAKQVLMSVLSSPILHPKVAIAVDEDVNIFNYWEVIWAINTRCNPQDDIVVIPGIRSHPMDPTGFEPFPPGGPYWHRVGGKVIIDDNDVRLSELKGHSLGGTMYACGGLDFRGAVTKISFPEFAMDLTQRILPTPKKTPK